MSDQIVVHIPSGGVILGLVHKEDGTPLGGIRVSTSDGAKTFATTTDSGGEFRLLEVPAGTRVISFRARGFQTVMQQVLVTNEVTTLDVALPNYVGELSAKPEFLEFDFEQSPEEQTNGIAHVFGQATNLDGPQLILVQNGEETVFPVSDTDGNFNQTVVLAFGENKIKVRAVNGIGETFSEELTIVFTGEFAFRATLSWSPGASDIDLHTAAPSGLSWYQNKVVAEGSLDVDNVTGYGPENFTCTNPVDGAYTISAVYYADHDSDDESVQPIRWTIRILVNPNTPQQQTLNFSGLLTGEGEEQTAATVTIAGGIATAS